MSKVSRLTVQIVADARQAKKGFDDAGGGLDGLVSKADKAVVGLTAASAGVVALGKQAFDAASALQQSTGAIESVFAGQADQIKALSENAAQAVGLSSNAYNELAAVMGAQLKNMGVSADEMTGKTADLISIGADLAATYGGTTADAVSALSSLMRGEADPIERYGVSIKKADIEARLAADGLDNLTGEARKQAETQALMKLLTEQTSSAYGAFAREADTAAGQQQRAAAEWENAKAKLGEGLLPIVSAAAEKLGEMAHWAGENPQLFQAVAGAIVGLTGAVTGFIGAVRVVKGVTEAWKVAQVALNFVLSANPIGIVVTAIGALAAGVIYAYNHSETFRNAVNNLWTQAKNAWSDMTASVKNFVNNAMEKVGTAAGFFINAYQNVRDWGVNAFSTIVGWIDSFISRVRLAIDWVKSLASNIPVVGGWLSGGGSVFGSGPAPDFLGVPPASGMLYGVPTPGITAAAVIPRPAPVGYTPTRPTGGGTTVNITVTGAVDPTSTARQIKDLLARYDRQVNW